MTFEPIRKSPSGPVIGNVIRLGGLAQGGGANHAIGLTDYNLFNTTGGQAGVTTIWVGGFSGTFENTTAAPIDLTFDQKLNGNSVYNAPMVQTVAPNSKAIVSLPVAVQSLDAINVEITVKASAPGVNAVVWFTGLEAFET